MNCDLHLLTTTTTTIQKFQKKWLHCVNEAKLGLELDRRRELREPTDEI